MSCCKYMMKKETSGDDGALTVVTSLWGLKSSVLLFSGEFQQLYITLMTNTFK